MTTTTTTTTTTTDRILRKHKKINYKNLNNGKPQEFDYDDCWRYCYVGLNGCDIALSLKNIRIKVYCGAGYLCQNCYNTKYFGNCTKDSCCHCPGDLFSISKYVKSTRTSSTGYMCINCLVWIQKNLLKRNINRILCKHDIKE